MLAQAANESPRPGTSIVRQQIAKLGTGPAEIREIVSRARLDPSRFV